MTQTTDTLQATAPRETENTTTLIACEEALDISMVRELYEQLQHALTARRTVVINAAHVERADTAALQMLCAFFHEAQASGVEVQWQEPSPALRHAARLLEVFSAVFTAVLLRFY